MNRLLLICFILIGFLSCTRKNNDEDPPIRTMASLSGTYRMTAYSENGVDIRNTWHPCLQDNIHVLAPNGVYTLNDFGITCPNSPSSFDFTWSLNSNQTIIMNGDELRIEDASSTQLVLSDSYPFGSSTVFVRITYTRQ